MVIALSMFFCMMYMCMNVQYTCMHAYEKVHFCYGKVSACLYEWANEWLQQVFDWDTFSELFNILDTFLNQYRINIISYQGY